MAARSPRHTPETRAARATCLGRGESRRSAPPRLPGTSRGSRTATSRSCPVPCRYRTARGCGRGAAGWVRRRDGWARQRPAVRRARPRAGRPPGSPSGRRRRRVGARGRASPSARGGPSSGPEGRKQYVAGSSPRRPGRRVRDRRPAGLSAWTAATTPPACALHPARPRRSRPVWVCRRPVTWSRRSGGWGKRGPGCCVPPWGQLGDHDEPERQRRGVSPSGPHLIHIVSTGPRGDGGARDPTIFSDSARRSAAARRWSAGPRAAAPPPR